MPLSRHFVVDVCPEVALSSISFQLYLSNRAKRKDRYGGTATRNDIAG
jgi:hypothetical protein